MKPAPHQPSKRNDVNAQKELTKKIQKGIVIFWRAKMTTSGTEQRWRKPAIITSVTANGNFTIKSLDDKEESHQCIYGFRKVNTNIYTADAIHGIWDQILFPNTPEEEQKWIDTFTKNKGPLFLQDVNIFLFMHRPQSSIGYVISTLQFPLLSPAGTFFIIKKSHSLGAGFHRMFYYVMGKTGCHHHT